MVDVFFFRSIRKINCYHYKGVGDPCSYSINPYMIGFGMVELVLSQIPNFHKLSWLSVLAAVTSVGYASIGAGLSLATIIQGLLLTPHLIIFQNNLFNPNYKILVTFFWRL